MDKDKTGFLLYRLNEIGISLRHTEQALALISFGSVGLEMNRLDDYSDLDFFVIVQPQAKSKFLDDLSWLSTIAPIAYHFRNTPDGYKLLFADGVFCEFAVFEEEELAVTVFPPGRVVWKAEGVPDTIAVPQKPLPAGDTPTLEWLLGEALTNLYVGLLRDKRGEKLSGMRFIQGYAVERLLDLADQVENARPGQDDPFSKDRRFEFRYPTLTQRLPEFLPGYQHNMASARAILTFLDEHFSIDPAMKKAILDLAHPA